MKDFLGETSLINFTKRRKVSDIISEIQQYQNQPYCLKPCPEFREYLENLDPFPDMKDEDSEKRINDYLWKKSNEVDQVNDMEWGRDDKSKIYVWSIV